ncbi:amidohydrolase family protein [Staphylothermus hellenicus]|uniref:amidohydrolase family protein n=1 Tax=Staphylothermus hellenicus TaxID=84599 RepID=UPI00069B0E1D|nr:amidohydrolase family protein [Staphylothermus hellenicus]
MVKKVSILIRNGLVVTMDDKRRIYNPGYVAIDEDKIVGVGRGDGADKYTAEEVIDARGSIVMPGFLCAHTHFYGELLRASPWFAKIDPPTDFMQNLQRIWWALDVLLTHEDAYAAALIGSIDFVKSGTTMFFDNISAPNAIEGILDHMEKAVNEVGLRGILSFEATQRRSIGEGIRGVRENERFIKKNNNDPNKLVKGAIYLHASFTVTDELFRMAREIANKYNALLSIHVEEGLVDVYHNLERYGIRPVERMEKLGFLGPDVILVHVVQANDDELAIIKKTGAHVAHNAMSNMLNAVGVPPIPKMMKLGINVGIGNDGYIFDVFENMRSTYLIHKVWNLDPRLMTPQEVVEMATINVAKMFGVEKELGSIEKGKKADIIIIKPEYTPTPVNEQTVYGHLINTFNGRDVRTVIVNGKIIMRDRKLLTIDEAKAVEYVHKTVEKLWDRLLSKGEYQLDVLELPKK